MKKIFMMAIAAAAMTITSCTGNKTAAPVEEQVDTLAVLTEEATTAADEMVSNLGSLLQNKDLTAFQGALETIKAKVAEYIAKNPETAQTYLAKVQTFLKENADAIKAFAGKNAVVSGLVDNIANIPTESVEKLIGANDALKALGIDASSLVSTTADKAVDAATDAAAEAVDGAKEAVENAKDAVVDKANETVENAKAATVDKANEAVNNAKEKAGEAVDKGAAAVKKGLGL